MPQGFSQGQHGLAEVLETAGDGLSLARICSSHFIRIMVATKQQGLENQIFSRHSSQTYL